LRKNKTFGDIRVKTMEEKIMGGIIERKISLHFQNVRFAKVF